MDTAVVIDDKLKILRDNDIKKLTKRLPSIDQREECNSLSIRSQ